MVITCNLSCPHRLISISYSMVAFSANSFWLFVLTFQIWLSSSIVIAFMLTEICLESYFSDYSFYWVEKKNFFFKEMRSHPKGKWTGFQLRSRKSWFQKSSKSQFKKEARQGEKKSKSIEMTTTYILLLQNIRYVYNSMR